MISLLIRTFTLLFFIASFSQSKTDTIKRTILDDVLINNEKLPIKRKYLSQQVESINTSKINFQNPQNTSDILLNTGTVNVQKSQQGGGSPVIRGFEASRVLLLVDGIRLNNLIYRSGHLQNILTVDVNQLENVDVFYGSTSTIFGSDALGGTINLVTKKPKLLDKTEKMFSGNITTRYSSVNQEKTVGFDFNFAKKNWASLTCFSVNSFDDLKMGKQKNGNNPFFGERNYYVETINNEDVLVANQNKYIQKFSGYNQFSLLQKVVLKTDDATFHNFNFQFSSSSNIPRYDRLTDESSSGLTNAEWYYGPQKRLLASYSFSKEKAFLDSDAKIIVSYQNTQESRHNRRFNNYKLQNRTEKVSMFSFETEFKKVFESSELFYGFESNFDNLNSSAFANNIQTGEISAIDTRYPNGKNYMFRNDLYVSYYNTLNNKSIWNIGGRVGYSNLKSTITDDAFFNLPFDEINQKNATYSFATGIVYKVTSEVSLITNISSGFRVPNVDDLSKIFESGNGIIVVPNENIKPEKTITTDFGFKVTVPKNNFNFETTYYYTRLFDAIVTDTFLYNNLATLVYNGEESIVVANQNKRKAFITGFSSKLNVTILKNVNLNANFNYTLGRIVKDNSQKTPLDHISPVFGKVGIAYNSEKMNFDFYLLYNGKKRISDYNNNGEDNLQYASQNGTPSWETYNFKSGFKIIKNATIYIGIENIFDIQYRTFSSGINAPGRNVYGGLKYGF